MTNSYSLADQADEISQAIGWAPNFWFRFKDILFAEFDQARPELLFWLSHKVMQKKS